ncbi:hypothetical protein MCOO_06980 [Mycobacterium cookii]|uniref:Uncharacterized protein n=2 Tax=Mycobacterium cookii TaxID=1775 RepID=A0A7I7KRW4_9MYCO|nr:hypothetical protein MCOO_06980 [Mycobacterium cookii]
MRQKNNNKNKTTKHTIEFSNNTHRPRSKTRGFGPLTRSTDVERSHRNGVSLWDAAALSGLAVSQRLD